MLIGCSCVLFRYVVTLLLFRARASSGCGHGIAGFLFRPLALTLKLRQRDADSHSDVAGRVRKRRRTRSTPLILYPALRSTVERNCGEALDVRAIMEKEK